MSLLAWGLATIVAVQAAPALQPADDDAINVVAERMRRMKLVTRTDGKTGIQRCLIKRSSGDAAFDAMMCDAARACGLTATTRGEMEACMGGRMTAFIGKVETPVRTTD